MIPVVRFVSQVCARDVRVPLGSGKVFPARDDFQDPGMVHRKDADDSAWAAHVPAWSAGRGKACHIRPQSPPIVFSVSARLFPGPNGRMTEESDRYAQARLYADIARRLFKEASGELY